MGAARFVIAGGGMVAGYAAKQMVELGLKPGELAILSGDDSVPYERPPLSKGFLAGKDTEESVRISPEAFYREKGIDVKLRCWISRLDAGRKRLALAAGEEFEFEKLLIATGANPRTLDLPGAKLENVLYLRTLDDSKHIRKAAEAARRAVVIGGGFIGMEVAAVLAQKNLEVTMVLKEDRIWERFFTAPMSQFFESYYQARGVRFVKTAGISKILGGGSVESVQLKDGQSIACDMVVGGIGVSPVTEWLKGSGVPVDNGVVVNEYLEAGQPGIFAAGDVANYPDLLYGKRRRVEHWDNAVSQGQHCARTLMGDRAPFRHVPYFFSDVFDLSYEFWGDTEGAEEAVHRGDLSTNSFSVWWLRQKAVVAAFTMNRPDEEREAAPQWIERKHTVTAAKLADSAVPLSSL